jgi:hypothetical protein
MREPEPDAIHPIEKDAPLLAPFHQQAFSVLWIATVVSNTGTWMQSAAAAAQAAFGSNFSSFIFCSE